MRKLIVSLVVFSLLFTIYPANISGIGKRKAAFIFLALDANPREHRAVISTPDVELTIVGVRDYQEAVKISQELVEKGVRSIILCASFGHIGVAKVTKAVENKAMVGVVRYDRHPGLGFKSGDERYEKMKA
ncbi:MAG: DUF6506 family protein [Nitrospirota bacterium]